MENSENEKSCAKHKPVLLACIRHAASVNPGPGSNPQIVSRKNVHAYAIKFWWTILSAPVKG